MTLYSKYFLSDTIYYIFSFSITLPRKPAKSKNQEQINSFKIKCDRNFIKAKTLQIQQWYC
jgi:hypothetical protein